MVIRIKDEFVCLISADSECREEETHHELDGSCV